MARLYIIPVDNHPIARRNTYWEEKGGYVQQIKMKQQPEGHITPDGYIGFLFPFNKIADAAVEIKP